MRVSLAIVAALGGLVLTACQSTGSSGFMPRQFVGVAVDQLSATYGEPVSVAALEGGRQLYVYETVSSEDLRQLSPQARAQLANAPRSQTYTMTQSVYNDDGLVIETRKSSFAPLSNPAYAPVLCTIEAVSGPDGVVQSVSVANDLCLTIRS